MKFKESIDRYNELIFAYENAGIGDLETNLAIMKELSVCLSWLESIRVDYHRVWCAKVFQYGKDTSNAAAERKADHEVQELYELRRIMTAGYKILDVLRSHISIIKQEQ